MKATTDRSALQHVIREMKKRGWNVRSVDNGGGYVKMAGKGETEILDEALASDDARIRFESAEGDHRHTILIVLGNSPWEIVADWGYAVGDTDGFDAAMNAVTDELEEF